MLAGERLQPRYWLYLVAALSGGYLIAFASNPARVTLAGGFGAAMAVGAAALCGMGTVFGRRLLGRLSFGELTGLRLALGAVAAAIVVRLTGSDRGYFNRGGRAVHSLPLLTLVLGLLGLLIYCKNRSDPSWHRHGWLPACHSGPLTRSHWGSGQIDRRALEPAPNVDGTAE